MQDLAKQVAKSIFKNFPFFLEEVAKKTEEEVSVLKKDTSKQIERFMRTQVCHLFSFRFIYFFRVLTFDFQECIFTVHDAYCKKYETQVLENGKENGLQYQVLSGVVQNGAHNIMLQNGLPNGNQNYSDKDVMYVFSFLEIDCLFVHSGGSTRVKCNGDFAFITTRFSSR